MYHPKISVVTVCYNSVGTIEETMLSVLNQTYPDVEYIIIDGGSTDGTVDIIKKYADRLSYWVSEPDNGMYDAIKKGFSKVTGDICCYINSDDFYYKEAFEIIANFFLSHNEILWVKGRDIRYNENSYIISDHIPNIVYNRLIRKGIYTSKYHQFIQQESIFWRSDLNRTVDWDKFSSFKLCGDYYMWLCFSQKAKLHIIDTYLGGFRVRNGQLSSNVDEYNKEVQSIVKQPSVLDILLSYLSKSFYKIFRGGILFEWILGKRYHKWNLTSSSFE